MFCNPACLQDGTTALDRAIAAGVKASSPVTPWVAKQLRDMGQKGLKEGSWSEVGGWHGAACLRGLCVLCCSAVACPCAC